MGDGIEIKCSTCDFERTFFLGYGMTPLTLENYSEFLDPYNEGILDHILLNHKSISEGVGEYKLFRCHKCGFLKDNVYFRVNYDDNQSFMAKYICPRCKTQMGSAIPEITVNRHPCPSCRKKTLLLEYTILWD